MHEQDHDGLASRSTEIDIEQAEVLRKYLGLDRPMLVRYGMWIWNLAKGDLGAVVPGMGVEESTSRPCEDDSRRPIWTTVILPAFTIVVTWTFASPVVKMILGGPDRLTTCGHVIGSGQGRDVPAGAVLMYGPTRTSDQSAGLVLGRLPVEHRLQRARRSPTNHLWCHFDSAGHDQQLRRPAQRLCATTCS